MKGGETTFYTRRRESMLRISKYRRNNLFYFCAGVNLKVTPQAGLAVVFNHDLLHQGDTVKDGEKFIVKTELIFRRSPDFPFPPAMLVS